MQVTDVFFVIMVILGLTVVLLITFLPYLAPWQKQLKETWNDPERGPILKIMLLMFGIVMVMLLFIVFLNLANNQPGRIDTLTTPAQIVTP